MTEGKAHRITLERRCSQKTSDKRIAGQIELILSRALASNRGKNWSYKLGRATSPERDDREWVWKRSMTFQRTGGHAGTEEKQWAAIVQMITEVGTQSRFGQFPWKIIRGNVEPPKDTKEGESSVKNYGEIQLERGECFDHIYERESHIDIIHSALVALKESDLQNRFHCCLWGPPGCGKSDILISISAMLGPENEAFLKFDATSMTEAGVSKLLLDSDFLPPVLIVEEIEKAEEKQLRWLLGILDHRAEIRRTNFRVGNRHRNVKMLCLSTVNNIKLFRNVMSGALASRFAHEIYCPRPSRDIMEQILIREVDKVNGDHAWIEPTLKFCVDEKEWNDPRKVVPICLCGRDDLLDGTYQTAIEAVSPPSEEE
jgi:hypothetical protein